jgi:vacuolar protein-sorting-associated protein 4
MSENICENSKVFDSLKTIVSQDSKTDLEEANILYNNAKFYYTTGELNGALVSYSCSAVLLNSLVRKLKQQDLSNENNLKAANDATKILNCCLSAVQELQGKVKKMSSGSKGSGKDEEKKDWEKICTNLQPLVFKDGSSDCLFFDDVAGLKKEKELLKSSLIYPLSYPNLYPKTAKGILIYGPPGTGKTYIVKAAVNELQKTDPNIAVLFFAPSPGDLKGKYVGETEKKIEEWFTCASKAACDAQLDCKEKKTIYFNNVYG